MPSRWWCAKPSWDGKIPRDSSPGASAILVAVECRHCSLTVKAWLASRLLVATPLNSFPAAPLHPHRQPQIFSHLPTRLRIGNQTNLTSSISLTTPKSSLQWPLFTVSPPLVLCQKLTSCQRHFFKPQLHSCANPASSSNNAQIYHLSSPRLSPSASSSTKPPPSPSSALSLVTHTSDTRQLTARRSLPSPERPPPLLPAGAPQLLAPLFRPTASLPSSTLLAR